MPDWTIGDCPATPEKRTYASRALAQRDRQVFHGREKRPFALLRPYACTACGKWHLHTDATVRRRSRKARRPR